MQFTKTIGWDKYGQVCIVSSAQIRSISYVVTPSTLWDFSMQCPSHCSCKSAPCQDQITSMVRVAGNRVAQRRIAHNKANDRNAKEGKLSYACASPFLLYPVLFWYRFGFCSARHIFPENILACGFLHQ